jgi:hypothetical protein
MTAGSGLQFLFAAHPEVLVTLQNFDVSIGQLWIVLRS